jgi:Ca-activated chloride channel family protein
MELAQPLALLLVAIAVPVWLLARRKSRGHTVASAGRLMDSSPSWRLRAARALPVLRIIAIAMFAIAAAGPREGKANAVVPGEGVDVALAFDLSSSMDKPFAPGKTRLEATKDVIREFIKSRENDRVGLVVFQEDALALSPPSLDYAALDKMVADLHSGLLRDGTGIGVGLATSLTMLKDSTAASRVVILLTDGEQNADSISPEKAADLAVSLKIRVYTIGVVSHDPSGRTSEIDENLLKAIADRTNARYFQADSPQALQDIYDEIGSLETSRVGRESFESYTELAPWFAGLGALLLVGEVALRGTLLRRSPA